MDRILKLMVNEGGVRSANEFDGSVEFRWVVMQEMHFLGQLRNTDVFAAGNASVINCRSSEYINKPNHGLCNSAVKDNVETSIRWNQTKHFRLGLLNGITQVQTGGALLEEQDIRWISLDAIL